MFFFFNDTATTEIYTLSLHDALPISRWTRPSGSDAVACRQPHPEGPSIAAPVTEDVSRRCGPESRSEEHTSELQSRPHLLCRLLLEKKQVIVPVDAGSHLGWKCDCKY